MNRLLLGQTSTFAGQIKPLTGQTKPKNDLTDTLIVNIMTFSNLPTLVLNRCY